MAKISNKTIGSIEVIILNSENGTDAVIAPSFGGTCISWRSRVDGETVELLHGANDMSGRVLGGRVPILFPATGRLFHDGETGRYLHKGKIYDLDIHGFAKDMPWNIVEMNTEGGAARVSLELLSTDETRASYPYDFRVRLDYVVTDGCLGIEATFENRSPEPMPFSYGTHPYFRIPIRERELDRSQFKVQIPGKLFWELEDGAPTGKILPLPRDENYRKGLTVPEEHLERVVAGLSCADAGEQIAADLLDPVSGYKISTLFNPGDLETVTVFSPAGAPFVCIEPRTGIPMDLSDDTHAALYVYKGVLSAAQVVDRANRLV